MKNNKTQHGTCPFCGSKLYSKTIHARDLNEETRSPYFRTSSNDFFLEDTYVFYDGPIFFSCTDNFGKLYFASASKVKKDEALFLLVEVSEKRHQQVLDDEYTLYNLYKKSESGEVLMIWAGLNNKINNLRYESSCGIPDSLLPSNEFLELSKEEREMFSPLEIFVCSSCNERFFPYKTMKTLEKRSKYN